MIVLEVLLTAAVRMIDPVNIAIYVLIVLLVRRWLWVIISALFAAITLSALMIWSESAGMGQLPPLAVHNAITLMLTCVAGASATKAIKDSYSRSRRRPSDF